MSVERDNMEVFQDTALTQGLKTTDFQVNSLLC